MFRPLGRDQIRRIVEILFERTRRMAEKGNGLRLVLTDAAKDALAAEGFDAAFGARPLKRVLQRQVANKLAEQILGGLVAAGDAVVIDAAAGGGVSLETVPAGEPVPDPAGDRRRRRARPPADGAGGRGVASPPTRRRTELVQ